MKLKKWMPLLDASALAFLVAFGSVGSLVSAFHLNVRSMPLLALCCVGTALGSAICYQHRHGGTILLCLMAGIGGILWHDGRFAQQLLALVENIFEVYDKAYHWGKLSFHVESTRVDFPIAVIGGLSAITVTQTIFRGYWTWPGVVIAVIPMAFCFVVTDTVPSDIYLYLFMLGIILLLLTARSRQQDARQADYLIRLAALPVAIALGILFLAVPQDGYVNRAGRYRDQLMEWFETMPEKLESAASDVFQDDPAVSQSREEQLDALGKRTAKEIAVMDVISDKSGILYLRGQDFDKYDGTSWKAYESRKEKFPMDDEKRPFIGETVGNVTISTRKPHEVLYLPYYTSPTIQLTGGRVENNTEATVYVCTRRDLPNDWKSVVKQLQDEIDSIYFGVDRQTNVPNDSFLALPDAAREGARILLPGILSNERSATEKADAIARYVRSSAVYDLNPDRMPSDAEDFAIWFLEESEKGYCVHFATAAAVLLRASGVHARYVTGYVTRVTAGKTVTVTQAQAHAWVEYFEPRLGVWIPLEATPASVNNPSVTPSTPDPEPGTEPETQPETKPEDQPGESQRPESTPSDPQNPTGTAQPENPDDPTEPGEAEKPVDPWDSGAEKTEDGSSGGYVRMLLILLPVAAVLAVIFQWRLRLGHRRMARRNGKSNDRALRMWQEHELLRRQLREAPLEELEDLAHKAKFSQHTLSDGELKVFRRALEEDLDRLKQHPWYRRIFYRIILAIY